VRAPRPWPLLLIAAASACGRLAYDEVVDAARSGGQVDARPAPTPDARAVVPDGPRSPTPPDAALASDAPAPPVDAAAPPADATDPLTSCLQRYPTALLCEDFEGPVPAQPSRYSTEVSSGAALMAATAQVHGGARALQASVPQAGTYARYAFVFPTPLASGSLHLRWWVYLPSTWKTNGWLITMQAGGPGSDKISADVDPGDAWQLADNVQPNMFPTSAAGAVARDRWLCLELGITIGKSGTGRAELRLNDAQILSTLGTNSIPSGGGFTYATFGISHSSGLTAPATVYVDDVVIARDPIGCN
jgi:hypothetical protein